MPVLHWIYLVGALVLIAYVWVLFLPMLIVYWLLKPWITNL